MADDQSSLIQSLTDAAVALQKTNAALIDNLQSSSKNFDELSQRVIDNISSTLTDIKKLLENRFSNNIGSLVTQNNRNDNTATSNLDTQTIAKGINDSSIMQGVKTCLDDISHNVYIIASKQLGSNGFTTDNLARPNNFTKQEKKDSDTEDETKKNDNRSFLQKLMDHVASYTTPLREKVWNKEKGRYEWEPEKSRTFEGIAKRHISSAVAPKNLGGELGWALGASVPVIGPAVAAITGIIGNAIGEAVNDHVLSIPKTSAAYYRAQYLAGMKMNNFVGPGYSLGAGSYLAEYTETGDHHRERRDSRVVYDQLRMYANTIGIKNEEFYKKFGDFIGAGGKFTENAVKNFQTSMTYEKQFGESFSMDFLNTFERVTGSTGDLNKHIQVLTGVAGSLTTVAQKHVQVLSENFYSTLRGQYDGETTRRALGRELALFTPLLSRGIVDSSEVSELLNIGKGQGVNQRMISAAFMPAYAGNFLGGAEAILQNTITPQGRLQNFENYMSILKMFTGGQSISSLSDDQMTVLRSQASSLVPAALLDKAVLKQLEEATNGEERDRILNQILNGQSASEEAAQSLHAMEEPLKAIRDNVVSWGVTGRLKREFSEEMNEEQLANTKYLGSFTDDAFTLQEFFGASHRRKEEIYKAINKHGISSSDFDTYAKIKMYGSNEEKTQYKELIERVEKALETIATNTKATAQSTNSIDNKQDTNAGLA